MKNILLPTDFSEDAWNAAKYVLELYKGEACVFHLLNTYTPAIAHSRFMAVALNGHKLEEHIRAHSENGLKEAKEALETTFKNPNHSFSTISSFSLLVDEIKNLVEREGIDLIVMGAKGTSGIEEVFMGSNTVRVIKSVKNCPVLAIPRGFEFSTLSEIAFATDFNRFYTTSELLPLIDLAKIFEATVRIVHVQHEIKALTEIQQFNLNMLRKYLRGVEHYVHTVSELNSVSKTLEVFAEELDIHLLAMLNYQHSYMETMTREPIIKRMVFNTQVPLLVIPELGMGPSSKQNRNRQMTVNR
jgi:nucleotide-binding universal stress UspA family protein